jgi:hypothetical protein
MPFKAAPGAYKIYAWSQSIDLRGLTNPEAVLKRYETSGQSVNVAPGASLSLRVTAIP